jgi:CheY-like chemotaxis protein
MANVLVAEDDRIHLSLIGKFMEKHKDRFQTLPAKDGQEAIEILERETIDLLVTDIQMPRVDGLALLAHVSQHQPTLPCFVMTAYGTPEMKARLPEDLLRFYSKPLEMEALAQDIIAALDGDIAKSGKPVISVVSFLLMIQMEKIDCIFEVHAPDKAPGKFYFKQGVLLDAEFGALAGEDAALALIPLHTAYFRVRFFPEDPMARRVQTDLAELIEKAFGE